MRVLQQSLSASGSNRFSTFLGRMPFQAILWRIIDLVCGTFLVLPLLSVLHGIDN